MHANYWCTEPSRSTPPRIYRSCEFFLDATANNSGFTRNRAGLNLRSTPAHSWRGNNRRVQRNAQTQRYKRRGQKRAQRSRKAVSGRPPNQRSARADDAAARCLRRVA